MKTAIELSVRITIGDISITRPYSVVVVLKDTEDIVVDDNFLFNIIRRLRERFQEPIEVKRFDSVIISKVITGSISDLITPGLLYKVVVDFSDYKRCIEI